MASTTATATDFPPLAIDFTSGDLWHPSAPRRLREATEPETWQRWSAHLAGRRRPDRPFSADGSPLLWALPEDDAQPRVVRLVRRLAALGSNSRAAKGGWEKTAAVWLDEAADGELRPAHAIEALAWAASMPQLAARLSAATWWNVLGRLASWSIEAARQGSLDESPLVHQLLAGELALTLAYVLPELAACRRLAEQARRAIASGIVDLLDGEGFLPARHMPLLRPLLACWTRCQTIDRRAKGKLFAEDLVGQFEWAVREALRWTRPDGSQSLTTGPAGRRATECLAAALEFDADDDDRRIAAMVLPGGKKRAAVRRPLPEAASHSDWACAAVLRPDWLPGGPRLSVLYPGRDVLAELGVGGDVLWSGLWECEIRRDGRSLAPVSDWEETCWVSDDDVDFLELHVDLAEGMRIERQMVMARRDRFLLVADAVLGDSPAELEYRGRLPLRPGVRLEEGRETREAFLIGRRRAAMVLPLALPEWRCDRRVEGRLERTAEGLDLYQRARAAAMYCPMFFDFDARRMNQPRTWRQLTVAADLAIQPADVAVGYRVHLGRQQWLVYRSLAERANRTVLGHNLASETLVARFDKAGDVLQLVEAE